MKLPWDIFRREYKNRKISLVDIPFWFKENLRESNFLMNSKAFIIMVIFSTGMRIRRIFLINLLLRTVTKPYRNIS